MSRRDDSAGGRRNRSGEARDDAPKPDVDELREGDALVQWLHESLAPPDPSDPGNALFYQWWAGELRARQGARERADADVRAAEFAARMVGRVVPLTLPTVIGHPHDRDADEVTTVRSAVAAAGRARAAVIVDHAVAAGVGRELWDEPAERWVDLPEQVPDGRYVALTVSGDSMVPALHEGDRVLVRLGPDLARDAIVVARRPDDGYVVKRVGAVTQREVELTSLNSAYAPVRIPRDASLVVGTVVLRWCAHDSGAGGDGLAHS